MRLTALLAALFAATPIAAQVNNPPALDGYMPRAEAEQAISTMQGTIATVQSTADAAASAAGSAVKTVNGTAPTAGNVTVNTTAFLSGFTASAPGTVASLLSAAPCNAARLGIYAVVSDLYSGASSTNEVMRCGSTGAQFYWRPQRTDFAAVNSITGGSATVTPLINAPTQVFTGTLTANVNVTPDTVNAWPGASFTFINRGVLGLFGINLTGVTGGTLAILGGGQRTIFYTCTAAGVCSWQGF